MEFRPAALRARYYILDMIRPMSPISPIPCQAKPARFCVTRASSPPAETVTLLARLAFAKDNDLNRRAGVIGASRRIETGRFRRIGSGGKTHRCVADSRGIVLDRPIVLHGRVVLHGRNILRRRIILDGWTVYNLLIVSRLRIDWRSASHENGAVVQRRVEGNNVRLGLSRESCAGDSDQGEK